MNFSKIWLITQHEFLSNFTRKTYLFTAFGVPLFIAVLSYVVIQIAVDSESNLDDFRQVAYVDLADVFGDSQPATDKDFARFIPYPDEAAAHTAFTNGDIRAYFVLPNDYMQTGEIAYYSDKGLNEALLGVFEDFLRAGLAQQTTTDIPIKRLTETAQIQVQLAGEDKPLSEEGAVLRFGLPIGLGFLFVFNILMTSQFLMMGIMEEKENHILEILATSSSPLELMTGKVIGLGGLALIQLSFWLIVGLGIGALTGRLDILKDAQFEPSFIIIALLYFVLTFMMFAGAMIGIGAVVSAEQESRQLAALFIVISILPPTWGVALFFENPNSPLVTFMSLFPLTAPISMMTLMGLGEAETWQIALSLFLMVLAIAAILWLSARVFRVAMLTTGQRLSLRQLALLIKG